MAKKQQYKVFRNGELIGVCDTLSGANQVIDNELDWLHHEAKNWIPNFNINNYRFSIEYAGKPVSVVSQQ